ncbi:hypothetical protein C7M84_008023 [Penaeus vannamei]|uniref:Uncharacterized protein n=1 Tax=Penaeus vannamei TaxID=6689 RepID=A0A423TAP2_PENVA|nr:hypothetical protein C7M84_008023 [Penaeus vannamei]
MAQESTRNGARNAKNVKKASLRDCMVVEGPLVMSSFRRELRKHESSKKSGSATDNIYTPTLWYFEDMMFICDQEMPRESTSNMECVNEEVFSFLECAEPPADDEIPSCSNAPVVKRSRGNTTKADHILNLVARNLEERSERHDTPNETFGNNQSFVHFERFLFFSLRAITIPTAITSSVVSDMLLLLLLAPTEVVCQFGFNV